MENSQAPQLRSAYTEQTLIEAILDGTFPTNSRLPGERTLAQQLGVTRPTLREAIQRLTRDGWLTVQQGKSTVVNDFWQEGGLNVLSTLAQYSHHLPPNFITQLLEVRSHLTPAYTRAAIEFDAPKVFQFLQLAPHPDASPEVFAKFDWQLHRLLTISSQNPIYTLILNSFGNSYEHFAKIYFSTTEARSRSRKYYDALLQAAQRGDAAMAEEISQKAMLASMSIWEKVDNWEK